MINRITDNQFKLVSKYQPSGDQPQAIEQLVDNIEGGEKAQILMGATGTGKTYTFVSYYDYYQPEPMYLQAIPILRRIVLLMTRLISSDTQRLQPFWSAMMLLSWLQSLVSMVWVRPRNTLIAL